MTIQVLVAAMHQTDHALPEQMHLQTPAVIGNQGERDGLETVEYNGHAVTYVHASSRGVGRNRNNALALADADVVLFADDDLVYEDGYEAMVRAAFEEHPDADAVVFNIRTDGMDMGRRINASSKRVRLYNALNYGAARLAVRLSSIRRFRLSFSQCFGGGTLYSSGEDTLFICDLLRSGGRIYTSPAFIATVDQHSSTWFRGYDKKYLYDKGAFYRAAFGRFARPMCWLETVRHRGLYKDCGLSGREQYRLMCRGAHGYDRLIGWCEENEI